MQNLGYAFSPSILHNEWWWIYRIYDELLVSQRNRDIEGGCSPRSIERGDLRPKAPHTTCAHANGVAEAESERGWSWLGKRPIMMQYRALCGQRDTPDLSETIRKFIREFGATVYLENKSGNRLNVELSRKLGTRENLDPRECERKKIPKWNRCPNHSASSSYFNISNLVASTKRNLSLIPAPCAQSGRHAMCKAAYQKVSWF